MLLSFRKIVHPESRKGILVEKEKNERERPAKSGGKKGLIIGLLLAVMLGAGGFYGSYSGLVPLPLGVRQPPDQARAQTAAQDSAPRETTSALEGGATPEGTAFVDLKPMVISLGEKAANNYLRLHATLEVAPARKPLVTMLIPRVMDVLNEYLRAVTPADIENPAMMGRLRAQLLHRVQLVTGADAVRDLLIVEFVLS